MTKRYDFAILNYIANPKPIGNKMYLKKCKSCEADIYFLITSKGNRMPVNAESLTTEEKREVEAGRELLFKFGKHIAHFATCPNAKEHRK